MTHPSASLLCTFIGLLAGIGGTALLAPSPAVSPASSASNGAPGVPTAEVTTLPLGAFASEESVVVPVGPEEAFDLFTGDVKPWWDHTFSGDPLKLEIDPFPGGAFREVFDEAGNGVEHARITGAVRGQMLRMDGPLGLAGNPLHTVFTLLFTPTEDGGTQVTVQIRGAGHVEDGWGDVITRVWHHFLVERFGPYVEEQVAGR